MIIRKGLLLVALALGASAVTAEEREEYLKVKKSTFVNLIDLMVNKGLIEKKDAKGLISDAENEAAAAAGKESPPWAAVVTKPESAQQAAPQAPDGKAKNSKYVAYIPEFMKEDIRNQVKAELKADVLKDVKAHAKKERWGIPEALPDWISRITPFFDMRLRVADELYPSGNVANSYYDWYNINQIGGISQALAKDQAYLNTTVDRVRLRERLRIGFDAVINENLKAQFRFATSNMYNPVSNNQTMGNYNQSWQFAIDRAFLQYDYIDSKGNDWVSVWGGRFANPFMSTDIVYDPDLSFQGFAIAGRMRFNQDDPIVASYRAPISTGRFGINLGPQTPNTVFVTGGAFPIQEINFSTQDKWLFGGQGGVDWLVYQESRLKFATSYYHYANITAKRNPYESLEYNWTAPEFFQKGNSLVAINDSINQPSCNTGALGSQNVCLVGLASGFEILNVMATFDYAGFAPHHVMLTADYAKNFGFNQNYIRREFGDTITPQTNAYQVRLDVGRPEIRRFNDWSAYFAYRYLERDAVLDAFTDSVFHQGGTNAKGWVLGVQYGLLPNAWVNVRWFSTDIITPNSDPNTGEKFPYSIDTINIDLNARL